MRSIVINLLGGAMSAACLLAGLPSAVADPSEAEALVDPYCTGPGTVIWKRQLGGAVTYGVATDKDGNVLIGGDGQVLVAKYSAAGRLLWKRQPPYKGEWAVSAATDKDGNVLIGGFTGHSWTYHGGWYGLGFVAKYSAAGNLLWKHELGTLGPSYDEAAWVATDKDGNVLTAITGYTSTVLHTDVYVAKYSAAGKTLWKRHFGAPDGNAYPRGVATDKDGNVVIGGWTDGSLAGPIQGGFADAFVVKYNADGKLLWKRQLGTESWSSGADGVATDKDGNVLIGGSTDGSLGGPNQGNYDAFVAKYRADGKLLWKLQFGTPEDDSVNGVATDKDGNVLISGGTDGSLGGPNQGSHDAFVAKYRADRKLIWKRQFGTPDYDDALGVATDKDGEVLIGGYTSGWSWYAFVIKLRP